MLIMQTLIGFRRVSDRGKVQAIEKETVPRLIYLLLDMDPEVRASAAGALAL